MKARHKSAGATAQTPTPNCGKELRSPHPIHTKQRLIVSRVKAGLCVECGNVEDRYTFYCGRCYRRLYYRQYRQKNRKRWNSYCREYQKTHPEQTAQIQKVKHDRANFGGNRLSTLERDNHTCRFCGATEQLVVHHVHGKGNHDSLITLCISCHTKEHARLRKGEQGAIVPSVQTCAPEREIATLNTRKTTVRHGAKRLEV